MTFEFPETEEYLLKLDAYELSSVVLALYHEVMERVLWSLDKGSWFRQRPFDEAQRVVNGIVSAYQKAFVLIQEKVTLDPDYMETFTIGEEQWRFLDKITTADSWDEVPFGKG